MIPERADDLAQKDAFRRERERIAERVAVTALDNVPAAIGTAVAAAFAKYPVAPVAVPTPMPK